MAQVQILAGWLCEAQKEGSLPPGDGGRQVAEGRENHGMTDTVAKLEEAIQQAAGQYYRLVLLAGAPGSGRTATLQAVAQQHGYPYLNVNLEMCRRMLELTRTQRVRQASRLFKDVIAAVPGEVVLLDNLEILHDRSLEIKPLGLLQTASRNRTLVATWNGSYRDGTLAYAEPTGSCGLCRQYCMTL
jgi:hypothetical protein